MMFITMERGKERLKVGTMEAVAPGIMMAMCESYANHDIRYVVDGGKISRIKGMRAKEFESVFVLYLDTPMLAKMVDVLNFSVDIKRRYGSKYID